MDDNRIIELYWDRDQRAIEETSAKYGGYCFALAQNILQDHLDSEECVNDTWVRTWNSIPPKRPDRLKLFLAKITRRLSFDRYKSRTAEKRGGGEIALALEELGDCLSDPCGVEDRIIAGQLADSMNSFLRGLSSRDCDIFLRRYFFVESTAQIAKRYSIRESNVLLILSRTRKKLKEYLIQEGYQI